MVAYMKFRSANDEAKLCMRGYSSQLDRWTGRKFGPVVHANDSRALKKFVPFESRIPQIWSERRLLNVDTLRSQGMADMNLTERWSKVVVYVKFASVNDQAKLCIRGYSR